MEETIKKLLGTGSGEAGEDLALNLPKRISKDELARLLHALETTTRHITHSVFSQSYNPDKPLLQDSVALFLGAMERNRDHCCSKVRTLDLGDVFGAANRAILERAADGLFVSLESLTVNASSAEDSELLDKIVKQQPRLHSLSLPWLYPKFQRVLTDNAEALRGLTRLIVSYSNPRVVPETDRENLISFLPKLSALRSLSLSLQLSPRSTECLARQLEAMSGLTELDLSEEHGMGEGMLEFAKELRHLTRLESLRLGSTQPQDLSLPDEVAVALARMSRLKVLILEDDCLSGKGLLAIAEKLQLLPDLTELTLHGKFSESSLTRVGSALRTLTRLRKLHLANSDSSVSAAPIAENLSHLTGLEDLGLCNLEWEVAFSGQLRHLTRLVSLSLQYCRLGYEAALAIAGECGRLSCLLRLDLSNSYGIGDVTKIELHKRTMLGRDLSHLESLDVGDVDLCLCNLSSLVKSYPLHFAAVCGDVTLVREVLASKVDPNQIQIDTGESAMFYAARAGHDEAIRVLVEEGGASLSVKNKNEESVVDVARQGSSTRGLLEEMVLTGADERPGEMIKGAAKRFKPLPQPE